MIVNFRSREDIAIWKERQIQVAREELRVKESLARLADEGKIERRLSPTKSTPTGLTKVKLHALNVGGFSPVLKVAEYHLKPNIRFL